MSVIVFDASAIIEICLDEAKAGEVEAWLEKLSKVKSGWKGAISSIAVAQLYQSLPKKSDAARALSFLKHAGVETVAPDAETSRKAASLATEYKLPLEKALVLATVFKEKAVFYTTDPAFAKVKGIDVIGF
jgi:predicted nucleic acid-binding protein